MSIKCVRQTHNNILFAVDNSISYGRLFVFVCVWFLVDFTRMEYHTKWFINAIVSVPVRLCRRMFYHNFHSSRSRTSPKPLNRDIFDTRSLSQCTINQPKFFQFTTSIKVEASSFMSPRFFLLFPFSWKSIQCFARKIVCMCITGSSAWKTFSQFYLCSSMKHKISSSTDSCYSFIIQKPL